MNVFARSICRTFYSIYDTFQKSFLPVGPKILLSEIFFKECLPTEIRKRQVNRLYTH